MNRVDQKFQQLKSQNKKAFIAFITAGDPDLAKTEELVLAFDKIGVDIVELGIPFSDPIADGKTIQASSQRALKHDIDLVKIFQAVKRIRTQSQIPLCLMTYYNPVFHYGEQKFIADCLENGVDGVIIPDLPPEEAIGLISAARAKNISTVFFLAPTTKPKRVELIANVSTGFIYFVSLTGVTGARKQLASSYQNQIKVARRFTDSKPICVGFGISDAAQVREAAQNADGVIVGSAIINEIVKNEGNHNLVKNVSDFVATLVAAVK